MIDLVNKLNSNKNYTYFISEIGLNHNGSVEITKKLIDVAKKSGSDAVKLQKRDVANLATEEILNKEDNRFPEFGSTYREVREYIEFNKDEYEEIKKYCNEINIDFLCTAFDIPSAKFLMDLEIDYFKIASHSVTNIPLIEFIAENNIPSILSTGMSEIEDIDLAYEIFKKNKTDLILLHCVSSYPTPENEMNLNIIETLKKSYNDIHIGYSGHEIGHLPTIAAVCKGARVVERHITLDQKMVGFDHSLSIEPNELNEIIKQIRKIEILMGSFEKRVLESELLKKNQYNVSMIAKRNIFKDETLTLDDVEFKNPGNGILYKNSDKYLGKKVKSNIGKDEVINPEKIDI